MRQPFRVLFVCTANVIRSPCAELLARTALDRLLTEDRDAVEVTSAGTWADAGRGIDRTTLSALRAVGVPAAAARSFVAAQLTSAHVARAALILCAAIEHRRAVWQLDLNARQRTFTLLEFADLLGALPDQPGPDPPDYRTPARGRGLVCAADALRRSVRAGDPGYDASVGEVPDPAGETQEAIAAAVLTITDALTPLWGALAGSDSTRTT